MVDLVSFFLPKIVTFAVIIPKRPIYFPEIPAGQLNMLSAVFEVK